MCGKQKRPNHNDKALLFSPFYNSKLLEVIAYLYMTEEADLSLKRPAFFLHSSSDVYMLICVYWRGAERKDCGRKWGVNVQ